MFPSSCGSTTIALTGTIGIASWMRTLPEGLIVLPAVERVDHIVGRQLVGAQLVGIDVDDDGPLVAAEGRRRRHARQADQRGRTRM